MGFMYELCLNPETARRLAENKLWKGAADQAKSLPVDSPEATPTAEEKPVEWSKDPRYAAAFAMILYWSRHGGC